MPTNEEKIVHILRESGKIRSADLEKACVGNGLMQKRAFFNNLNALRDSGFVKKQPLPDGSVYYVLIKDPYETSKTDDLGKNVQSTKNKESDLLHVFKKTGNYKIGSKDSHTQVFPKGEYSNVDFYDNIESSNQITILVRDYPVDISNKLIKEVEKFDILRKTSFSVKLKEGSEGYPRLIDFDVIKGTGHVEKIFQLKVAPSKYGLAYLAEVTESNKSVKLSEIDRLKREHSLNSLAVRIGLVHTNNKNNYLIFHQRMPKENATYQGAWDVSAAGYINPSFHSEDGGKTISPWLASRAELSEELTIREELLPFRENYKYFGLIRNAFTGQLDIFGVATANMFYEIKEINRNLLNMGEKRRVKLVKNCILDPISIAKFIRKAEYWVPTAIVTVVFILHSLGYTMKSIEKSFAKEKVLDNVKIAPFL